LELSRLVDGLRLCGNLGVVFRSSSLEYLDLRSSITGRRRRPHKPEIAPGISGWRHSGRFSGIEASGAADFILDSPQRAPLLRVFTHWDKRSSVGRR
ncbi:unnamed protein product, partial [Linum tenue]